LSLSTIEFPRMVEVRQRIPSPMLEDFVAEIRNELRRANLQEKIKPGSSIAVTAGSRGIAHYVKILATVVEEVKRVGGKPFIVPAMGSHGGATSEGQITILEELGITPETVGAPILATMEVEIIGRLENGVPVYLNRNALRADGIIVVARVKPHTDFKGKIESGLMKMMAIGLGNQKGAETIHHFYGEGYHKLLPEVARVIIERAPIILGLAVVENARHEIAIVKAIEPRRIEAEEMHLLEKAKEMLGRIPFKEVDVLIVDEIGKDTSGLGMDTNVTGRFWLPGEFEPSAPKIKRIVALDLTEKTRGNALGIGLADFATQRLVQKIDYQSTLMNVLTSGHPELGKIPVYLPSDREAIAAALKTCGPIRSGDAKVVRIRNTLELERFWISESLCNLVKSDPELKERLEILGEPIEMRFDTLGTLAS